MAEEFKFDPEQHIVIAGKVYERESMGDELKAGISHINFSDQELATMEQNVRVYRLGRDAMVQQLIERIDSLEIKVIAEVPDNPEDAQPPAPEPAKREKVAAK